MDKQAIKRPLQVVMPIERIEWVQKKAQEQERSMTWIVNQAVEEMRQRDNATKAEVTQ